MKNDGKLTARNFSLQCWTISCSRPAKRLRPTGRRRLRQATIREDASSLSLSSFLPPARFFFFCREKIQGSLSSDIFFWVIFQQVTKLAMDCYKLLTVYVLGYLGHVHTKTGTRQIVMHYDSSWIIFKKESDRVKLVWLRGMQPPSVHYHLWYQCVKSVSLQSM